MIPILDLKIQYQNLKNEIDSAMQEVAAAGNYILGPNVKALESDMAAYCDCKYGVGVANGTDALHLSLRALRVGPGDEVITSPFTFIATTEAIGMVGATPVFVDIDLDTFNMDPALIEKAISPRTKAIMPVHLYGQPCDMDPILDIAKRHKLFVVEDCAQAIGATCGKCSHGSRVPGPASYQSCSKFVTSDSGQETRDAERTFRKVGSLGDLGCLSFFPSKNLGAFGDAGMVVTNNKDLADRVEMLRRHGGRVKYQHEELGLNSRLDELQAAILRVKFKHLEDWISSRRRIAYRYNELLKDLPGISTPKEIDNVRAVYHQYTIILRPGSRATKQHRDAQDELRHGVPRPVSNNNIDTTQDSGPGTRDAFQLSLRDAGIQTMVYYPVPLHLQEVHANLGYKKGSFPNSEAAAETCFSLPMFPELTTAQQDETIQAVRNEIQSLESRGL